MAWKSAAILFATLALAAPGTGMSAPAGKPAAKSAARPGSPRPIRNAMPDGPLLFHGYACGSDCGSHEEGYSWASAHKISNPMECRGTSETFIEGCRAFAGIEGPMGEREIFQDED